MIDYWFSRELCGKMNRFKAVHEGAEWRAWFSVIHQFSGTQVVQTEV